MYHNHCIICQDLITTPLTIDNLFSRPKCICQSCQEAMLAPSTRKRCPICKKKLEEGEDNCLDCMFIKRHFGFVNAVDFVCDYNEKVSSLIHQYKSNGDILLAQAFAACINARYNRKYFRQFDYIIPLPISEERLKARGFNHVTEILKYVKVPYHQIIDTEFRDKQMNLSKTERMRQESPFRLNYPIKDNSRILLVDDIYTTGLTMSHARSVFLSYKHCEIKVLAFARA